MLAAAASVAETHTELTHVVASRNGLYFVSPAGHRRVAEGRFFGVTVLGEELYAFEAMGHPWLATYGGRILRFRICPGGLSMPEVVITGLDNGCHQIDFFGDSLFVIDTYQQRVLEFDAGWRQSVHYPVARLTRRKEPAEDYVHLNSFLGQGDTIYLLLHHRGLRPSEVLVTDPAFREQGRFALPGWACHDLVWLEDGRLLSCGSLAGELIDRQGPVVGIDDLYTRGLSVGVEEIVVGSSLFAQRVKRDDLPGFVTFLDRNYHVTARLALPGAPTQIRRLDGCDRGLSTPRQVLA